MGLVTRVRVWWVHSSGRKNGLHRGGLCPGPEFGVWVCPGGNGHKGRFVEGSWVLEGSRKDGLLDHFLTAEVNGSKSVLVRMGMRQGLCCTIMSC